MRSFALGITIGSLFSLTIAYAQVFSNIDTNGVLKGYTVTKNGKVVCEDPTVWLDFRGQGNFIVCE